MHGWMMAMKDRMKMERGRNQMRDGESYLSSSHHKEIGLASETKLDPDSKPTKR